MQLSKRTTLIIVPGHSIWKGTNSGENPEDWHLESFQKEGNDHLVFIEHIKRGIQEHQKNDASVLIFSGGQTKEAAGEVSEAETYFQLAKKLMLIDDEYQIYLEEYARDSFENVLFSLCRFNEITGAYPEKIIITGFEFKRYRFQEVHLARALSWDLKNVEYIGMDPIPPYDIGSEEYVKYFEDLSESEHKFAVKLFEEDLIGNGPVLGRKKAARNPFDRQHSYIDTNPLLKHFFEEKLPEDISPPWKIST